MPALMAQLIADNIVWWALCAALVFGVQAGLLLCRPAGWLTRKHIGVALLGAGIFLVLGIQIMFGAGTNGFIGFGFPGLLDPTMGLFVLYHFSICAIVITILTQIISVQPKLAAYIITIILTTGLIYPLIGHWVWGNRIIPDNPAFLADVGFIDGAGSALIHVVAASLGLAFLAAEGTGKIPLAKARMMRLLGAALVGLGWLGFYGPLLGLEADRFGEFIVKIMLAGAGGASVGLVYGLLRNQLFNARLIINGLIAGLISLCAGIGVIGFAGSFLIAIMSAGAALGTAHLIAQKVQHGAFDVLCVHGIAGAIGTILVAGFCDPTVLVASSRMMQFSVQTFGTILIGGVSFGSVYGALLLLKKRGAQRDVRPVPVPQSTLRPARQTRLSQPIATPSLAPILQTQMAQMTQIMAQHRNISAQLQRSSESLVTLLEELRKYAKTRVETITLTQAPFNLPNLIAQVVHQSKQQARTNVTLKTLYHPSLSQEFIADSGRIRQILNHLLANAIQYTASGSIILKVDGKQTEDDIDLVIGIADTGIGIAPDQLKDLFETADHLSLSICKSLVNSLGGEIGVVSKLGQGSTFWVRMPLRLAPSVALTNISKTAA